MEKIQEIINRIKAYYSDMTVPKIVPLLVIFTVVIAGVLFTIFYKPEQNAIPIPHKAEVAITLVDENTKEKTDITCIEKADIEIIKDGESVENIAIGVNEPTTLTNKLGEGEYTVHMASAPIESDGSTYSIPEIDNIVISKEDAYSDETFHVEISLERIDVNDMTKEQLEATVERIGNEASDGNNELIESLKNLQETAVSDPTPVEDTSTKPKEPSTTIPKTDTSSVSKPSSNNNNTGSAHTHNWVANMVSVPATGESYYDTWIPDEINATGYAVFADGCKVLATESAVNQHVADHGAQTVTNVTEKEVVRAGYWDHKVLVASIPEHDEQRGYICSCGATKD